MAALKHNSILIGASLGTIMTARACCLFTFPCCASVFFRFSLWKVLWGDTAACTIINTSPVSMALLSPRGSSCFAAFDTQKPNWHQFFPL